MAQSLSKNYIHTIFHTKNSEKFLTDSILNELYPYISSICKTQNSPALKIGGMPDHIHILCLLYKNISLAKLVEEIKKNSSKWIKTKGAKYHHFSWQNGYAAFSVSQSLVEQVIKYIENQKTHHHQTTFQEEYIAFLKHYKIDYDERYIWT